MIRLTLAGPDTLSLSTLCARCPAGPAGCCATPPGVEWSDIGRIVARGGASFLLDQIAASALRPGPRGLFIRRVAGPLGEPHRCAFFGPAGCTLPPDRRAATCNYYVCDDAIAEAGEAQGDRDARRARRARDQWMTRFGAWDRALADRVADRYPAGPPWDHAFLAWLGDAFRTLAAPPR